MSEKNSELWCVQEHRYLLDLGLHGRRDGRRGDKLEGWRSVVWILSGKLHHQVNLMAAEVSRHHTAAVHSVHLHNTKHCDVTSCLTVSQLTADNKDTEIYRMTLRH